MTQCAMPLEAVAGQPQLSPSSRFVRCRQRRDHLARDESALMSDLVDDLERPEISIGLN